MAPASRVRPGTAQTTADFLARAQTRHPTVPAIRQLARQARTPARGPGIDFLSPLKRLFPGERQREQRTTTLRPLRRGTRRREDTLVIGNEAISRRSLNDIERLLIDTNISFENTISRIALSQPELGSILTDREAFHQFVSQFVSRKWKTQLFALENVDERLRAVAIVLYLRVAHRNPKAIRPYIQ